ncbi:aminotransferase class V-fold PLP-dependent enzyme [Branchiibius sp. NY16-3462-2]|uniref:kynureninase n=1 Tax=Branchiibius sp. NY16-3462-2 TaxID=1807500 RepID=UPI000797BBC5|nr:aminotransferase class V-fold PLP-dependent enzyme [Branchiibius sp. NY16-3462-2]KYH46012.1 kynureninase [Branchiibius sp. NY16-3462-2]
MDLLADAADRDRTDPLAYTRDLFVPSSAPLVAYLDGNSLGRPLKATHERLTDLVDGAWGTRLIRSWDEQWMELPFAVGDALGTACLGAAPGQTAIGDSTTVLLYKLLRAAVAHSGPDRPEIVLDSENFPTDRYVAEGIAAETGCELVWLHPDPSRGVTADEVASVVGPRTGVVLLSQVAYKSGYLADLPAITRIAHDAGALVLWDLCHSAGSVPIGLDAADVDLAVGCSYKYLNGGPGAPAFCYVASRLQSVLSQPIQGWMGNSDVFAMGPTYAPATGMRRFISGTPPVLAMTGIQDTVALIESIGIEAVREKSTGLGEFVIAYVESNLSQYGVQVASPRNPTERGGHVTLTHPDARSLVAALWERDVIPDFREPDGIRIGAAPLSTSYTELAKGLLSLESLLRSPH